MPEQRVDFPLRAIVKWIGIVVAAVLTLYLLWLTRQVLSWILIAVFLALALNPAVEWVRRHGVERRGLATASVYLAALVAFGALSIAFVPTLIDQIRGLADAVPGYIKDLTSGHSFLGSGQNLPEKAQKALEGGGAASGFLGVSGTALALAKGVLGAIVAAVTIVFMTFFMLLEGPSWFERSLAMLPEESRARWRRVGQDVYRTVSGYVAGNLLISLIAGTLTTIVLLIMGVPDPLALGLIVALLDLVPLAGATVAAVIIVTVSFLHSTTAGVVILVFFVLYQQIENHVLQPFIYGKTVRLSPLAVLIAVLLGAQLAGVLGALLAIPVAGSVQAVIRGVPGVRRADISPAG